MNNYPVSMKHEVKMVLSSTSFVPLLKYNLNVVTVICIKAATNCVLMLSYCHCGYRTLCDVIKSFRPAYCSIIMFLFDTEVELVRGSECWQIVFTLVFYVMFDSCFSQYIKSPTHLISVVAFFSTHIHTYAFWLQGWVIFQTENIV